MTADECEFFSQDYCCPPDYIVKAGFVCGVFMKRCGNCARNTGHTYCHQMLKVRRMPADGRGADPGLHAGTGGERA